MIFAWALVLVTKAIESSLSTMGMSSQNTASPVACLIPDRCMMGRPTGSWRGWWESTLYRGDKVSLENLNLQLWSGQLTTLMTQDWEINSHPWAQTLEWVRWWVCHWVIWLAQGLSFQLCGNALDRAKFLAKLQIRWKGSQASPSGIFFPKWCPCISSSGIQRVSLSCFCYLSNGQPAHIWCDRNDEA